MPKAKPRATGGARSATPSGNRKPKARAKREAAIEVFDLVRVFKGGVRAVDGIDLEVFKGEI